MYFAVRLANNADGHGVTQVHVHPNTKDHAIIMGCRADCQFDGNFDHEGKYCGRQTKSSLNFILLARPVRSIGRTARIANSHISVQDNGGRATHIARPSEQEYRLWAK